MFGYYRMKYFSFRERRLRRKTKTALIKYLKRRYKNSAILFGTLCPIVCDEASRDFYTILGIKVHRGKLYVLTSDWFEADSCGILNYSDIIDLL